MLFTVLAQIISVIIDMHATKHRRLDALRRRVPHVTVSAIARILDDVAMHGIPEQHSRYDFRMGRDSIINAETPFGSLLVNIKLMPEDATADADPPFVLIAQPHAMMWFVVHECEAFSKYFLERLQQYPSTEDRPWRIILSVSYTHLRAHET